MKTKGWLVSVVAVAGIGYGIKGGCLTQNTKAPDEKLASRFDDLCVIARENITSPEDMHLSLSLRMLAPEASTFLRGLLGSIEFFSIWGLVLVVLGLRSIFGLRTGQAVSCVIPLFIIYAAIAVLSEFFINFGQ